MRGVSSRRPTPRATAATLLAALLTIVAGREVSAGETSTPGADLRSPETQEIIDLLDLAPLFDEWDALSEAPAGPAAPQGAARRLDLQREIDERVVETAFEVDQVVDAIDGERADLQEVVSWGGTQRDRHLTRLDIAVGILASGAAFGSALSIFDETTRAGTIVSFVAGAVGAGVTLLATRAPAQTRPPYAVKSRMLGPYFGLVPPAELYPPPVWHYLTRAPPGSDQTRRQRLLVEWRHLGRAPTGTSMADRDRLANLVDTISPDRSVNFKVLADRALMLSDVRAQALAFKLALGRFLVTVRLRATGRGAREPPAPAAP